MTVNRIIELEANTSDEVKAHHAEINSTRDVKRFKTQEPHDGQVCIVGGGPSLADTLDELRWRQSIGQEVWATNNTFAYLVAQGIKPDAHVLLDARAEVVDFIHPTQGVKYYLNVRCNPGAFGKLEGCDVTMYDMSQQATGTTVGLKAMYIAGFSGFRKFHLFGMDSSHREREHHAYPQPLNDNEQIYDLTVDGVKFRAAAWMIYQAEEFQQIAASFAEQDCIITVSGDGLIPFIARRLGRMHRVVTAVYDLTVCPPTYDFISFLGEAERHRLAIGAEAIDLVFLPGPVDGFRDDILPDGHASRVGMIYRVCVGAARLMPSIRNIEFRKTRKEISGLDIFPVGYLENPMMQHYGCWFFNTAMPVLKATEISRKNAAQIQRPYVTITLRESSHWPQRNSTRYEWEKAAEHIRSKGFNVVWIPDIESPDANQYSWDIDLRLGLYEGAEVNLGVNNGPMCMLFYADVRYIIFKMVTYGIPWTSPDFFTKIGMLDGPCQDGRGKLVWAQDTAHRIIEEFDDFIAKNDPRAIPEQRPNTPREVMLEQIRWNLKRELPMFIEQAPHNGTALIVGGGPSLNSELVNLRRHHKRGGHIFACNGAHDWLIERGIVPHFHVLVDARPENVVFVKHPHKDVTYLVSAQCHASVFDALEYRNVIMWVPPVGGVEPIVKDCDKPVIIVMGGSTVGMSAVALAKLWGYRRIRMFGMDSCYMGESNHAYPQPLNDGEGVADVEYAGRVFKCAHWMAKQAEHFDKQLPSWESDGCQLHIHGDGLLAWIHQKRKEQYVRS